MASAMKSTTKAMISMNKAVDAPAINKMMAEFERENMKSSPLFYSGVASAHQQR